MTGQRLFGTNGVRGEVGKEFTPELAVKLGIAVGSYAEVADSVFLARDGRLSGPMLQDAFAGGLMAVGCDVVDLGLVPTPAIQLLVRAEGPKLGAMVTASHNPPNFNGVKVFSNDGIELPRTSELEIERIFFGQRFREVAWQKVGQRRQRDDAITKHKTSVVSQVPSEVHGDSGLTVVVDPGNGVGSLVTPYVLRALGCRVISINAQVDGSFPGRSPEPVPQALGDLCQAVKALGADLGVAHDGDADRAVFVDERGEPHWGDKTLAVIIDWYLSHNPRNKIVTPVSSSKIIADVVEKRSGTIVWTKVGSVDVSRKMLELDAPLGGEENGGVFYGPHLHARDGAMAAALIVWILSETKKELSTLVELLPRYFMVKRKVMCPDRAKHTVLDQIGEKLSRLEPDLTDGVKVWYQDGSWALIRPSGTEPLYRVFVESQDQQVAQRLADEHTSTLLKLIKAATR